MVQHVILGFNQNKEWPEGEKKGCFKENEVSPTYRCSKPDLEFKPSSKVLPKIPPKQLVLGQTGGFCRSKRWSRMKFLEENDGVKNDFVKPGISRVLSDPKDLEEHQILGFEKDQSKYWKIMKEKMLVTGFGEASGKNSGAGVQLVPVTCPNESWPATCNWRGCKVEWWCNQEPQRHELWQLKSAKLVPEAGLPIDQHGNDTVAGPGKTPLKSTRKVSHSCCLVRNPSNTKMD